MKNKPDTLAYTVLTNPAGLIAKTRTTVKPMLVR